MSKGVHVYSGCARYRSVYVCITVKGSRVCEHCDVLAVRKYVRASMVRDYSCTTPSLATLDLNVHLNVLRICKILGSINDNISDITLIIVHVVKKGTC